MMTDVIVSDQGTIVQFYPVSQHAKYWVTENVNLEPWQWLGATFSVDHRYADDLIAGMREFGLEVRS